MRLLAIVSLSLLSGAALAAPVYNPANGHYYEFVSPAKTWNEANAAANAMTYMGLAGHLATITSQAETSFFKANFDQNEAWLGAFQDGTETSPSQGFKWVTGEAFSYTNWGFGEPNDGGGKNLEEYLQIRASDEFDWNDNVGSRYYRSYVEYEAVPEPAPIAAFAFGGLALLRRRRK